MCVNGELIKVTGTLQGGATDKMPYQSGALRAEFWRGFVATLVLASILCSSLIVGLVATIGIFQNQMDSTGLAASGRTGRAQYPIVGDSMFCRSMVFDNKTAQIVEERISRCEEINRTAKRHGLSIFKWRSGT